MKKITSIILLLLTFGLGYGQEIASFSSVSNSGCSGTVSNDTNITTTGICRGAGITENAGLTYNSRNWTTNATIDTDDYLEWTLSPNTGYEIDLSTMDISYDRSGTGPTEVDIQINTGSGFVSVFSDAAVSDLGEDNNGIDLSSYTGLTSLVTFRLYAFNASGGGGTFDIEENTLTNKGVVVNGTVSALGSCSSVSTWDGTSWSPSAPDLTTVAIIDGAYTTDATNGSFSACTLIVSSNTLSIEDGYYVEVENDVTVDGTIIVQPEGAFIQNSDSGTVTNNGTIQVAKDTAPLNNWYEYTYWSSPVSNATVGVALSDSDEGRRFTFNGALFNDEVAETANNNVFAAGQDDIDDNGDAWQWVSGTATMTPGVGYAATHSEIAYVIPGANYRYTFEGGVFNNGAINVPVNRNDATSADLNWNFIGNPYPSAVSISEFLDENVYDGTTNPTGTLDGVIYFWSQNTNYSATANGSEALNFDTTDYATHNGIGGTVGGDGETPNGFIPSGQGFFVLFSESQPSSSGNIVFNNAMRSLSLSPDNSQFFKNRKTEKSSSVNKFWIDLTSDNGVFNQILIGYADGATDGYDSPYYDARKIVAPKAHAALFSIIEGSENSFAIQGKSANSLNQNEIVQLGFKNNIEVPTLFKLSLAQFQGDFITNNGVYLKDNLLNKVHNLSESDYTFTSEVGEFNNRFVIAFNNSVLSSEDALLDDGDLRVVDLGNDNVKFNVSNSLNINAIEIYDTLGRNLYTISVDSSSKILKLSKLKSSIFIARVTLSNGAVITKKATKN